MLKKGMITRSLSDLLTDLQNAVNGKDISIQALLEAFHERGFGFFLFLFALPSALPVPGLGLSTIMAFPLILLTIQQALGRKTIWIPKKWHHKKISSHKIDNVIKSSRPWVKRIEYLIRPRLSYITHGIFSYMIGISGFIMALALALPIPFTNTVPAVGIAIMAIGVLMRDGLAVIIGAIIGSIWVILLVSFVTIYGPEGFDIIKEFIKGLI